jgi:hypothetical protein
MTDELQTESAIAQVSTEQIVAAVAEVGSADEVHQRRAREDARRLDVLEKLSALAKKCSLRHARIGDIEIRR